MDEIVKQRKGLRRGGALAGFPLSVRLTAVVVLAVTCGSLVFTQLGFAGIGPVDEYVAYAVILLLPVALAALLLGTIAGTAMGLFAGAVLLLHANVLPLDNYELSYITPLTSIAMLGVIGFLLGFLFAFALRKNPPLFRSAVYIIIICFFVSFLYSIGFVVNVIVQLALDLVAEATAQGTMNESMRPLLEMEAARTAIRLGDVSIQILVDGILMSVSCIVAEIVSRKMAISTGKIGLRRLFNAWVSVVVFVAVMILAGISFVNVTKDSLNRADVDMRPEVDYACKQLDASSSRAEALVKLLEAEEVDFGSMDDEKTNNLVNAVSIEGLLAGYAEDTGSIVFAVVPTYWFQNSDPESSVEVAGGDIVLTSNNQLYPQGTKLEERLNREALKAINTSLQTGSIQRFVYDEINESGLLDSSGSSDSSASSGSSASSSSSSSSSSLDTSSLLTSSGSLASSALSDLADMNSYICYTYAQAAEDYVVVEIRKASAIFADRAKVMAWMTLSSFILLCTVFAMVSLLLSRVVARRIDETNSVLMRVADGDLDAQVNVRDTSEFESLSNGINSTVNTLKGWIAEAETRMDAELSTAKAIQEAALPRTFPPYPDIGKFDIYASMNPAKEVGGDFYDFFLIGDDAGSDAGKLGFVMADVSGKGVPAALFMMKSMTQIRDYLVSGMEVGEAVENANRQLCDGNDAGMFVTAWVGVLDYATGHIDYVNAGHNPPLLWQSEGGWRWMTEKSGLPLGLFDGFPYEAYAVECGIGDQLLLYTDGVTEAMNVEGELFGESRLEELVQANYLLHPRRLVEIVRRAVAEHAAGAEQSDDITILALEVGVPPEVTAILTVPARTIELTRVNEFIHAELDRRLCPLRAQSQLDIAVEELFVNVCHYAYPDATDENPGIARISVTYSADPPSIVVGIADDGIPYDPMAKPDAVTPDNIMDVPIGGLGILMAKRSVDEMSYERIDGSNVVTLVKKW